MNKVAVPKSGTSDDRSLRSGFWLTLGQVVVEFRRNIYNNWLRLVRNHLPWDTLDRVKETKIPTILSWNSLDGVRTNYFLWGTDIIFSIALVDACLALICIGMIDVADF